MTPQRKKIEQFWEKRAKQKKQDGSFRITNLEEDDRLQEEKVQIERRRVFEFLDVGPEMAVLDLGAGVGAWSTLLAQKCRKVVAVEFCTEMISAAKEAARQQNVTNIDFVCQNVCDLDLGRTFDVIFISGLLLYVLEQDEPRVLKHIAACSQPGTTLLLREPTGMLGRYEINDRYSEALKANYSALYRTRDELVAMFDGIGFQLLADEDMFEEGSPLNKWTETRLRLYRFRRTTQ